MTANPDPLEAAAPESKEWLIRKNGRYYRADYSGYTTSAPEAGRYTESEAAREVAIEPQNMTAILAPAALSSRESGGLLWRCDVTGNPTGTDTEMIGKPCACQGCRAADAIAALSRENGAAQRNVSRAIARSNAWRDRAEKAEARLAEAEAAIKLGLDVISDERGWGTYLRMEGSEIYDEAQLFSEAARSYLEGSPR